MNECEGNDNTGRKRKRTTRGSQTDEDSSNNMAETLAEINRKLDLALARVKEIDEIKEKQHQLEKEKGYSLAHQSIGLNKQKLRRKRCLSLLT